MVWRFTTTKGGSFHVVVHNVHDIDLTFGSSDFIPDNQRTRARSIEWVKVKPRSNDRDGIGQTGGDLEVTLTFAENWGQNSNYWEQIDVRRITIVNMLRWLAGSRSKEQTQLRRACDLDLELESRYWFDRWANG